MAGEGFGKMSVNRTTNGGKFAVVAVPLSVCRRRRAWIKGREDRTSRQATKGRSVGCRGG
jgi:hypothetical protein